MDKLKQLDILVEESNIYYLAHQDGLITNESYVTESKRLRKEMLDLVNNKIAHENN